MVVVHVFIDVKRACREEFIKETLINAQASLKEPGIDRFDLLQETGVDDRFVLIEVYRTKDDPARHKDTAHYKRWCNAVKDMMAKPRTKKIYKNIFPEENGWN